MTPFKVTQKTLSPKKFFLSFVGVALAVAAFFAVFLAVKGNTDIRSRAALAGLQNVKAWQFNTDNQAEKWTGIGVPISVAGGSLAFRLIPQGTAAIKNPESVLFPRGNKFINLSIAITPKNGVVPTRKPTGILPRTCKSSAECPQGYQCISLGFGLPGYCKMMPIPKPTTITCNYSIYPAKECPSGYTCVQSDTSGRTGASGTCIPSRGEGPGGDNRKEGGAMVQGATTETYTVMVSGAYKTITPIRYFDQGGKGIAAPKGAPMLPDTNQNIQIPISVAADGQYHAVQVPITKLIDSGTLSGLTITIQDKSTGLTRTQQDMQNAAMVQQQQTVKIDYILLQVLPVPTATKCVPRPTPACPSAGGPCYIALKEGVNYCPEKITPTKSGPTPSPKGPTPPPGCYYKQVWCIKAPCPMQLICPTPSPGRLPLTTTAPVRR